MKTIIVRLVVICVGLIFINLIVAAQSDAKIDPKTAMGVWLLNEGKGKEVKDLKDKGVERMLGIKPVDPLGKLATSWGNLKTQ